MSLNQEERDILVDLELERAQRIFGEIDIYIQNSLWSTLANRMYYSAFHAVTALLIRNHLHAGTHLGVSVLLNKHFIKEGIISKEEGNLFAKLEMLRESGDYNCYVDTSSEELMPLIEPLRALIKHIETLVK